MTGSRHTFDVVSSEVVLEAPIIAVRRDQVVMPGGSVHAREIVEHFGAVAVVAVNGAGELCLMHQWRQAAGDRLFEIPAGLLDKAGEDPLVAAQRELCEEAGLAADSWTLLIDMFTSPGFAEEATRIYLAEDVRAVPRPEATEEEADLTQQWLPVDDAVAMVARGEIANSIAVAGILLAQQVLSYGSPRRSVTEPFDIRPTSLAHRRVRMLGSDADLKNVPAAH